MTRRTQADLIAAIRGRGLRATDARAAVLAAVVASRRPVSHAELVHRLARHALDRTTVFRNLATLSRAGLVTRLDIGDHVWRFVASAPGSDTAPGATFECTGCGETRPLRNLQIIGGGRDVPRAISRREVAILVRGTCNTCSG